MDLALEGLDFLRLLSPHHLRLLELMKNLLVLNLEVSVFAELGILQVKFGLQPQNLVPQLLVNLTLESKVVY